jgi:hypothetical protein
VILLGIAIWAQFQDDAAPGAVFLVAIVLSGILDSGLAVFYIPHVHENPRLRTPSCCGSSAGLSLRDACADLQAIYVLPEKPRAPEEADQPLGGAWYADPWGEAPFRWWDGERWTDWVTGTELAGLPSTVGVDGVSHALVFSWFGIHVASRARSNVSRSAACSWPSRSSSCIVWYAVTAGSKADFYVIDQHAVEHPGRSTARSAARSASANGSGAAGRTRAGGRGRPRCGGDRPARR